MHVHSMFQKVKKNFLHDGYCHPQVFVEDAHQIYGIPVLEPGLWATPDPVDQLKALFLTGRAFAQSSGLDVTTIRSVSLLYHFLVGVASTLLTDEDLQHLLERRQRRDDEPQC